MILDIYWSDMNNNKYNIASLEKKNELYILDINESELKQATHSGCFGIGDIKFLQNKYISKDLFSFFRNRIPSSTHPKIDSILKRYNMVQYDEMELLRATEGRLATDNYYCKEREIQ